MNRFLAGLLAASLLSAPAMAQQSPQPTAEDMRAAYEAATMQRNRAQNEQVEMAVGMHKLTADFEARLETAMQWLKAAQAASAPKGK